jgi:hypothetical protein
MADAPRRTGPPPFPAEAIGLVVIPHLTLSNSALRVSCCASGRLACRRRALEAVEKVVTGPLALPLSGSA